MTTILAARSLKRKADQNDSKKKGARTEKFLKYIYSGKYLCDHEKCITNDEWKVDKENNKDGLPKSYRDKSDLNRHLSVEHTLCTGTCIHPWGVGHKTNDNFKSPTTTSSTSNTDESSTNSGVKGKTVKCKDCKETMSSIYSLNRHIMMGSCRMIKFELIKSNIDESIVTEQLSHPKEISSLKFEEQTKSDFISFYSTMTSAQQKTMVKIFPELKSIDLLDNQIRRMIDNFEAEHGKIKIVKDKDGIVVGAVVNFNSLMKVLINDAGLTNTDETIFAKVSWDSCNVACNNHHILSCVIEILNGKTQGQSRSPFSNLPLLVYHKKEDNADFRNELKSELKLANSLTGYKQIGLTFGNERKHIFKFRFISVNDFYCAIIFDGFEKVYMHNTYWRCRHCFATNDSIDSMIHKCTCGEKQRDIITIRMPEGMTLDEFDGMSNTNQQQAVQSPIEQLQSVTTEINTTTPNTTNTTVHSVPALNGTSVDFKYGEQHYLDHDETKKFLNNTDFKLISKSLLQRILKANGWPFSGNKDCLKDRILTKMNERMTLIGRGVVDERTLSVKKHHTLEDLEKFKPQQLKDYLNFYGFSSIGCKDRLIKRILKVNQLIDIEFEKKRKSEDEHNHGCIEQMTNQQFDVLVNNLDKTFYLRDSPDGCFLTDAVPNETILETIKTKIDSFKRKPTDAQLKKIESLGKSGEDPILKTKLKDSPICMLHEVTSSTKQMFKHTVEACTVRDFDEIELLTKQINKGKGKLTTINSNIDSTLKCISKIKDYREKTIETILKYIESKHGTGLSGDSLYIQLVNASQEYPYPSTIVNLIESINIKYNDLLTQNLTKSLTKLKTNELELKNKSDQLIEEQNKKDEIKKSLVDSKKLKRELKKGVGSEKNVTDTYVDQQTKLNNLKKKLREIGVGLYRSLESVKTLSELVDLINLTYGDCVKVVNHREKILYAICLQDKSLFERLKVVWDLYAFMLWALEQDNLKITKDSWLRVSLTFSKYYKETFPDANFTTYFHELIHHVYIWVEEYRFSLFRLANFGIECRHKIVKSIVKRSNHHFYSSIFYKSLIVQSWNATRKRSVNQYDNVEITGLNGEKKMINPYKYTHKWVESRFKMPDTIVLDIIPQSKNDNVCIKVPVSCANVFKTRKNSPIIKQ
ncbi:hypothetical protein ACTFIZ_011235 [Dictyostelium cf. discoideum]